ncbi:MAG: hypothetical protein E7656_10370 [Ruminococcaceae bacterium]|nr:hypothetical protein [Oscillospiraceae bacterium]
MTEDIRSMLMGEFFSPNCRVKVRGEHFFTDKKLYSNMYGIAFFSEAQEYGDNPHISPSCERLPGILDEYFTIDNLAENIAANGNFELRDAITQNIDKKFIAKPTKKREMKSVIECSYLGHISQETDESILLSYGAMLPTTLCITGNDTVSAVLPFSPFPNLSFLKGQRTFMTVDYPIPTEPFLPPEDITIDFAVTAKKMEIDLKDDLSGKIVLAYSIEVGVTNCEVSKVTFEIVRDDEHQSVE